MVHVGSISILVSTMRLVRIKLVNHMYCPDALQKQYNALRLAEQPPGGLPPVGIVQLVMQERTVMILL